MKKSKKKSILDICLLGSAMLFGALTLIMMVTPGIINSLLIETKYSVYELLNYGDELRVGLLLAMIFAIITIVTALLLLVLRLMNKKTKLDTLCALIAGLLGVVGGILFFLTKSLVGLADSSITTLGIGAILSGVFAILAGLGLLGYAILKFKK